MRGNKIFQVLKEDLDIKMDSVMCRLWKETHENCRGCPSEKGCKEHLARIMRYTTQDLIERGEIPKSYGEMIDKDLVK